MIRLIAAIDRDRGIAKCGCIPWKIPNDEQYFNDETKKYGGTCLIGQVTFLTFSRPLEGRHNFVLTDQPEVVKDAEAVRDVGAFLAKHKDIWVIGGASVFAQTIEQADELYLTPVDAKFGCDRFFPEYKNKFELVSQSDMREENGFNFRYEVWRKK